MATRTSSRSRGGSTAKGAAKGSAKKSLVPWHRAKPAPVVLISGNESVLVRKAQDRIVQAARKNPDLEVVRLDAARYDAGALSMATAPSLFSSAKLVLVDGVAQCSEDFLKEALAYLEDVNPDVVLVLKHSGGNRGAKLLKAIEAAGHPRIDAQVMKSEADKQKFAQEEFDRAERRIEPAALDALMAALGADLSELAAGVDQLLQDTEGVITEALVDQYYGGRVEATGFKVADAAVAGRVSEALTLLRHAISTGTDPVPIVAAIAGKLRTMARVQGIGGSPAQVASELRIAPWQVDRARRDLRSWNDVALGRAILDVADADEAVKGGGRDPVYAVERLVTAVARAARTR
ncbi:DNA polymerase III subunit delta [Brevibacterium samyangense]|uniref:DNA polymerase III subunit delta n=1 Tax=Brevibacterium samyangense TaxID=366888 RepID=A0ABP5EVP7_9MICO